MRDFTDDLRAAPSARRDGGLPASRRGPQPPDGAGGEDRPTRPVGRTRCGQGADRGSPTSATTWRRMMLVRHPRRPRRAPRAGRARRTTRLRSRSCRRRRQVAGASTCRPTQPVHRRARRGGRHRRDQREDGGSTPRTGARCSCECTSAGPSVEGSSPSSTVSPRAPQEGPLRRVHAERCYAYGLMTSERRHPSPRRMSPFDNQGRRQPASPAVRCGRDGRSRRRPRAIRRHPHRRSSGPPAPAASTSTRPHRRCA